MVKIYLFQSRDVLDLYSKQMSSSPKLKKSMAQKKLYDKKKQFQGKDVPTDNKVINYLFFYGNAIRQHSNSVKDMRNAVWAIYFHMRSTDNEPLHSFCPASEKHLVISTISSFKGNC
ncbi:hypothetical protein AVEN_50301-1 [Araneus ventricosus]|uniref:Uncharacterized protein n=1 Tax=Araneus ventricosus TaxID=182803 RepID=A0A4Y2NQ48_ARAVE|nr:hypothetical protein AVEN_50301-1 [Araneus ventricosus]